MTDAFAALGLPVALTATLADLGYEVPTPIQEKTIPTLLEGRDLIGQAQTGTGKTAAFSLPLLAQLDPADRATQALVLTPTRELAMQVAEAMHSYAKRLAAVSILPVYGGAPIVLQMKHLQRGAQIVVGTPGRIIDHLDRGTLDLGKVRMVVLDEADEMLKMGFIEEVERMLSLVPKPRQVALFSATMPEPVARIAQRHLSNPVRVEIEHHGVSAPAIEQRFLNVSEMQKLDVLTQILELEPADAALIFRRTKTGAAELAEKLEARGFAAVAMHGDMKQSERETVIRRLRSGKIEIVVATDVAARGLDVEQITHVINYDIPYDVEAYVHRIGRTGRAGRSGVATLFITPRERKMMREIERFTGTQIKPMKMPSGADIAARRVALFKESLRKEVETGDLDLYLNVVTELAAEGPFDMAELAAAAARLASGARSLAPGREAAPPPPPPPPRPAPRGPGQQREEKVRLSMAVGKRDGIRPTDIVGSIANEADVPGREIGPIDIREDITYVEIPLRYRDQVLEKVARAKFRGRPVNVQVATPSSDDAPPRERPRFTPPSGERPRFAKPSGERPRFTKPSGERRPFAKPSGDRPPFVKPSGERPRFAPKSSERPGFAPPSDDRPRFSGDKKKSAFQRFEKPNRFKPKGPPRGPGKGPGKGTAKGPPKRNR